MTKDMQREAYNLAAETLSRFQTESSDLSMRLRFVNEQIIRMEAIKAAFKDAVCPSCLGRRYVRVQYAQDDIKAEPCTTCNKTGLSQ